MTLAKKVTTLQVKNDLLERVNALGNSNYGFKEVCSDLINQHFDRGGNANELAKGTFLSPPTLDRMGKLTEAKSGQVYRPNADTCERILRYFGAEVIFRQTRIKAKYSNQPKQDI